MHFNTIEPEKTEMLSGRTEGVVGGIVSWPSCYRHSQIFERTQNFKSEVLRAAMFAMATIGEGGLYWRLFTERR